MSSIDVRRFLNNFARNYPQQKMLQQKGAYGVQNQPAQTVAKNVEGSSKVAQTVSQSSTVYNSTQNLQLNTLQSIDRSIYAKDLLQMPKNINEFIYMLQRGLTQSQFNQMFANQLLAQKNTLSQIQAQILAQLQGLNVTLAKEMVNAQVTTQLQSSLKNLSIISGGMINLEDISLMLQKNGKESLAKLIMTMTEASKSGITDLSQMKDMAKLINASIAVASENNPQKTLKLLLMLYLPWLPLEEGIDFNLEMEPQQESKEESDSILTVTITTVNYGVIVATLILETSNSVQVQIKCNDKFPKAELKMRISGEEKHYAMESVLTFSENKELKASSEKATTNVNMSQTTEINPYLLLMSHTVIKHVIDIDKNKSLGIESHVDKF